MEVSSCINLGIPTAVFCFLFVVVVPDGRMDGISYILFLIPKPKYRLEYITKHPRTSANTFSLLSALEGRVEAL